MTRQIAALILLVGLSFGANAAEVAKDTSQVPADVSVQSVLPGDKAAGSYMHKIGSLRSDVEDQEASWPRAVSEEDDLLYA